MLASKYDTLLEPLLAVVRVAELFLGPEDDWVEDDRRILYEVAQRRFGHIHRFVQNISEDDYIVTADITPDEFEELIMPPYHRNLTSGRKYREHHSGGKQWAVGSFVIDNPNTTWQHHVYIFPTKDNKTDIYAHTETSVREGAEHLTDKLHHGTPYAVIELLDSDDVYYRERNL